MINRMGSYSILLSSTCLLLCIAVAIPDGTEKKSRVVTEKPVSDQNHYEGEEHNPEFDHEAFLGKDEAKVFDELTPEESMERLGKIVDKMDVDGDEYVTLEEMKSWIQKSQKQYLNEDADKHWQTFDSKNGKLSWIEYVKTTYGYETEDQIESDESNYKTMINRDKKRWDLADLDKDGMLSKDEFSDFLHPEEADHMKHVVIEETMEDIDKDNDGKISLAEYIGDLYEGNGENEPEWVKTEREQFSKFRDANEDGYMDKDEVQNWILPPDYDHSEAEAKHLISESDTDDDGKLTKQEILEKYDVFVGSQATDYGDALTKHEEL